MNIWEIIAAVLSSSVIGSILTLFGHYKMNHQSFKHDFYKKVIDKRIDAYGRVESLTNRMQVLSRQKEGLAPLFMCLGYDHFTRVSFEIPEVLNSSLWLSSEICNNLQQFNRLFNEIDNQTHGFEKEDALNNILIRAGIEHCAQIRQIRHNIQEAVVQDFKKLYDVKSFMDDAKLSLQEDRENIFNRN